VQTAAIRLDIAQEAVDVHAMQRKIIETSIRILEQTIHGSVSRNTKAKADYLATVAEGMSKKLQLQHGQLLTAAYAPEMQEALEARATQLERERLMLQRKTREANERIAEYTQSRQLAELAREYADIRAETAKVRQDLTKLGIS
jgi:chaperonin cofactor prefoldin